VPTPTADPTTALPLTAWRSTLGPAPRVTPMTGSTSAVWRVADSDGRAYVLKRLAATSPAALADEHRVLTHLVRAGVPAAPAVRTDAGTLTATERAIGPGQDPGNGPGPAYQLTPELPADHDDPERRPDADRVCFRIGAAIGRLHVALASYPDAVPSYELDLVPRTFDEAYPRLPPDVIARTVAPLRARMTAALADLPRQLIHGDCHPGNVLVHDGDVSGFVDVDHLPVGPRIYDLAYHLTHRVRGIVTAASGRAEREEVFRRVVGRYVDGYHASRPMTAGERAAVVPAMLAGEMILTEWNLRDPAQAEWYEHGVRSLVWMSERYDELLAAVGAPSSAP